MKTNVFHCTFEFCIYGCVSLILLACGQSANCATDEQSKSEMLKSYLRDCPNVKSIIFKRRLLSTPKIKGDQLPSAITNRIDLFQGTWQPGNFFVRQLRSIEDVGTIIESNTVTADLLIDGRTDGRTWDLINNQITSWPGVQDQQHSPNLSKVKLAENILHSAIRFGVLDLQPRTLEWHENSFSARNSSGKTMEGLLSELEGVPKELIVRYPDDKSFFYGCEYEYGSSPAAASFPSRVRRYNVVRGTKSYIWQLDILVFELTTTKIASNYFSPELLIATNEALEYVTSNGFTYKILNKGILKLPTEAAFGAPPARRESTRYALLSVMVISAGIGIALVIRTKTQSNQERRKNI